MAYQFTLDNSNIEVAEADAAGRYRVQWNGVSMGYMYVSDCDKELSTPVWAGSSPILNIKAQQIGKLIEAVDL